MVGESRSEGVFFADLWARYEPSRAASFQERFGTGWELPGINGLEFTKNEDGKFDTYSDERGQWVSAYAPVVGSAGEVVGAIGIDFEADYVQEVRQRILYSTALAFAITYLVLFVLVY